MRLADPLQQHGIKTKINVFLFETKHTSEGELIVKKATRLKLEQSFRRLILWPETLCHVIDHRSPLYDVSPAEIARRQLEIGISMSGESCRTGQFSHARTSYLPREILWGHRFVNMINYDFCQNQDFVDFTQFDVTIAVPTPKCSARQLDSTAKPMSDPVVSFARNAICDSIEENEDEAEDLTDLEVVRKDNMF